MIIGREVKKNINTKERKKEEGMLKEWVEHSIPLLRAGDFRIFKKRYRMMILLVNFLDYPHSSPKLNN